MKISYLCLAVICPMQKIILLIREDVGQGNEVFVYVHLENSFRRESFIVTYESFIVTYPETDRREILYYPNYTDFKIPTLIRNVDNPLRHRANALDICFNVAIFLLDWWWHSLRSKLQSCTGGFVKDKTCFWKFQ